MSDTQTTYLVDVTNNATIIDIKDEQDKKKLEEITDLSLKLEKKNNNNSPIKNIPIKLEEEIDPSISTSPMTSSITSASSPSTSSLSSELSLTCKMEQTHIHTTTISTKTETFDDPNHKHLSLIQPVTNENNRTLSTIDFWCRYCGCIASPRWRSSPHGSRTSCNKCYFRQRYAVRRGEVWELDWETNYYPIRPGSEGLEIINNHESEKRPRYTSSSSSTIIKARETKRYKMGQLSKSTLRGKKEFLNAGLYSGATNQPNHKNNKKVVKEKEDEVEEKEKKIQFKLPIYHGEWLLETEIDFDLPLDIIEDYVHDRLFLPENASTNKPPKYTRLQQNSFIERKPRKADQPSTCQCEKPKDGSLGCGEDCLNRMMFIECDPEHCPCEEKCSNLRFKKREFIKELDIFFTKDRGWGLKTLIPIKKGTLITEYRGEIISEKTCQQRIQTIYRRQRNFYFLDYNRGEVIDACSKGSEARFINHGCDPNCHIEKWNRGGEYHLGVFALKNIEVNEELFYDYNFSWFDNNTIGQECFCGSENCRGTIGKKKKA